MCANTCPNEQYIMTALRKGAPEKIPSFCQSIMEKLVKEYMEKYEEQLTDDKILLTDIGDLTIYRAFGYSSHWCGGPSPQLLIDDALRDKIDEMNEALEKQGHENYEVSTMGSIKASNNVTHWFVEPGIKTEEELKFFLDHWKWQAASQQSVEKWRKGRQQCMDANFVPFCSTHVVMEPANQSISFGLSAKLMRKNPALIERFYDFIVTGAELEIKAGIDAGYKCFCTADDMAYKSGPMFSPELYRRFVTPCAKRLCDLVHKANGVIFMHTDGLIDSVMDCFIDAGYDGIQPLEPTSGMTIERVKRKWGEKLCCIGNVDTTNTLSFGKPEDARKYVHRCFKEAKETSKGDKINGYIFAASGSLHNGVQLENALAMMDEYKKIRDGLIPI
jgi:hypothetical protein